MKKHFISVKKSIALFLSAVLILSVFSFFGVSADEEKNTDTAAFNVYRVSDDYGDYLKNNDLPDAEKTNAFSVDLAGFIDKNDSDAEIKENYKDGKTALVWGNKKGEITYKITVSKSALYYLDISYLPLSENGSDIEFG